MFSDSIVRTYEVEVPEADLRRIDADPAAEEYVSAVLHFEGRAIGPIGLRYKGSVGAWRSPCTSDGPGSPRRGKCSIKLSFNRDNPGGTFYGLRKLNFHSMINDPSMLRDRLAYRLFRDAGNAASRAVHARLVVNGELWGLYALVEQVDGRFTRSRFHEGGTGNLYKEIWPVHDDPALYRAALKTNEDEGTSVDRMLAFKDAVHAGLGPMSSFIDRAQLMYLLAVDRVIIHDDGLFHFWCFEGGHGNNPGPTGNHNYYWYEGASQDRFWLVPWDMDLAFDANPRVRLERDWFAPGPCDCRRGVSQTASSCDPLIRLWMKWLPEYEAAVDAFIAGPFAKERVDAMIDSWIDQMVPHVEEGAGVAGTWGLAQWRQAVAELRRTIDQARENRGFSY